MTSPCINYGLQIVKTTCGILPAIVCLAIPTTPVSILVLARQLQDAEVSLLLSSLASKIRPTRLHMVIAMQTGALSPVMMSGGAWRASRPMENTIIYPIVCFTSLPLSATLYFYLFPCLSVILALQGACRTKPAPGSILILNNTLFGNDTIQVTDPLSSTNYEAPRLSSSAIVGIVIGAVILLALAAGFIFVCIRKRKNRAREQDRASGYSFRCQTRVTPVTPRFPENSHGDDHFHGEEKAHVMVTTGIGANLYPVDQHPWNSQSSLNVTISRQENAVMRPSVITALTPPSQAYISPRASSPDDFATPASAVSTHSNAPLLGRQPPGFTPSPHLGQSSWSQSPNPYRTDRRWEEENGGVTNALGLISKKKSKASMGSPVQSEILRTSFPPPPTR